MIVAIIPARKGSKRLPGKNSKLFCGKPLICWTVDEALKCDFIDKIIVSTNDYNIFDLITKKYSWKHVKCIKRPDELAEDNTPMWKVIEHALEGYDISTTVILLQPTSPLRTSYDISASYDIFNKRLSCSLFSVFREDDYRFKLNGAIYIFSLATVLLTKGIIKGEFMGIYLMPEDRSIDIDTLENFELAEKIMKRRIEKNGQIKS